MTTQVKPETPAQQDEANYGDNLIWKLVGSTITSFGANEKGEIYLSARKDGKMIELIVGNDPDNEGGVALFEVEKREVQCERT
jgi:hypothetical protein